MQLNSLVLLSAVTFIVLAMFLVLALVTGTSFMNLLGSKARFNFISNSIDVTNRDSGNKMHGLKSCL